jgi:hypothetical protein
MKSILYILLITFFSSNIYADNNKFYEYMKKQNDREREKIKKEWDDPHNKQIRELEKKHFGKVINGDKEQQKLHQDLIDSTKTSK